MLYKSIVKKISTPAETKTKQKEYLSKGILPIVDQGSKLIGGYSNDVSKKVDSELPVIVFGDHSKAVKYINFPFGAGADGIKVLKPVAEIDSKFLYYGTQYLVYTMEDKGYARHYQFLEKKDLHIPPLPEQEKIVLKIEELFSELDKGIEELEQAKARLKVYRQSVLKNAFEGKRESVDELSNFIEKPRYGTSQKCDYAFDETKTAVYRIPNIDYKIGRISHKDIKFASFAPSDLKTYQLEKEDILIIRSNGSVSLVGRASIITEDDTDGIFAGYLIRIRIKDKEQLCPKYLLHFLSTHEARTYIEQTAKSTSGVNNINAEEIKKIKVPLPQTLEVQKQIVEQIESKLSICDNIEKTITDSLKKAESLRQSILKKAFNGELV